MRYQIILEGKGSELDRCEVETEEEIRLELYHALIAARWIILRVKSA